MTAAELAGLALATRRAVLLVIDVQERLAAAMPPDALARLERSIAVLLEAAGRLAIPVVVSEQYPRGLGRTIPSVATAVAGVEAAGGEVHRFDKLEFAACDAPAFGPVGARLAAAGRDQWIVTGMEAHVCVWQTARGLRGRGAHVHVVADAVASRADDHRRLGLELAARAGAAVTPMETVVFDLLGRAGTEDFKALSRLLK